MVGDSQSVRASQYPYYSSDKTFDLDLPETEEEEPVKSQGKKELTTITRGSNILARVVANTDVGLKSAFTEEQVPPFGVLTDHEAELSKAGILSSDCDSLIFIFRS